MDFRKVSAEKILVPQINRVCRIETQPIMFTNSLVCFVAPPPQKDLIGLKVNKLSSVKNVLPYEYYSLPYCRPEKIEQSAENLGEVLRGDRIENSLYQIQMRVDEQCKVLCRISSLTTAQTKAFKTKVEDDYRVNM